MKNNNLICSFCNEENTEDSLRCNQCGKYLIPNQVRETLGNNFVDPLLSKDEILFIKDNVDFYKEMFFEYRINKIINPHNQIVIKNLSAFFLTLPWLFYRKMYMIGTIVIFILGLVYFLLNSIEVLLFLHFVISYALGLFGGNYIYMKHIEAKIVKVKDKADESKQAYIEKHGGTNIIAGGLVFIIIAIVIIMGFR